MVRLRAGAKQMYRVHRRLTLHVLYRSSLAQKQVQLEVIPKRLRRHKCTAQFRSIAIDRPFRSMTLKEGTVPSC